MEFYKSNCTLTELTAHLVKLSKEYEQQANSALHQKIGTHVVGIEDGIKVKNALLDAQIDSSNEIEKSYNDIMQRYENSVNKNTPDSELDWTIKFWLVPIESVNYIKVDTIQNNFIETYLNQVPFLKQVDDPEYKEKVANSPCFEYSFYEQKNDWRFITKIQRQHLTIESRTIQALRYLLSDRLISFTSTNSQDPINKITNNILNILAKTVNQGDIDEELIKISDIVAPHLEAIRS